MKNIKYVIIIMSMILLLSCTKEKTTQYQYMYLNESSKTIKLAPYMGGILNNSTSITVLPGNSEIFSTETRRGKNYNPKPHFEEFGDSMLAIWDGIFEVLYIADNVTYTGTRKTIDTNSVRTILKLSNYELITDENRNSVKYILQYTFTEADYEYAKD